jgi:diguanylate cyclase (GGDEF)-like protein
VPAVDPREALVILLELTRELTAKRPLEESLALVTEAALRLVPANHSSVRLLDASRSTLLSGARAGAGADARPMEFRPKEGVLAACVAERRPIRIDDVTADPRFVRPRTQGFPVRSLACEPMWSSGEVIGVLSVTSAALAAFDDEAQLVLRLLANCSSPPVERARLERLAMFDDLTHALSQRYLSLRLAEELERATRSGADVSLLLLDLDHFKLVNDEHGHAAGDAVLRAFADRVRAHVRKVDSLVRRGGEEFVLVMPGAGATAALATGARLRETLDLEPLSAAERSFHQTVSIGVATWDRREAPEALEARADAAMYRAKRLGRNRVVASEAPVDPAP